MPLSVIALPIVFAVFKVAAMAGLGFLLARRGILHSSATADISNLVIKVAVPCLVFANAAGGFAGISSTAAIALIAAGPAVIGAGYLCAIVLTKIAPVDIRDRTSVVAASAFQNSAYLPIAVGASVAPLVAQSTGHSIGASQASGIAVICISLFGVLYSPLFWGIGLGWITDGAAKIGPQFIARLFPPPVLGLIAGYTVGLTPLRYIFVPATAPLHFLLDTAVDIGGMTIPIANLVLGAMLAGVGKGVKEPLRNYAIVVISRFVLVPAFFLTLTMVTRQHWIHSPIAAIAAFIIFLESITPSATNLAVMSKGVSAGSTHRTAEVMPRILLVVYLLCMLTMPAWLLIFLHLMQSK